jgi:hypothetical protein
MKKNSLICLFVFSAFASVAQWNTSSTNIYNSNTGNVGIGTSSPTAKLEINPGWTGQSQGIRIWGGNSFNAFGNTQIVFSYGGGGGYSHVIKTRHMSSAISGNAFDFYVWQPGDVVTAEGSLHVMTLNGDKVGIGTTSPGYKLDVQGPPNDWKARFQGPDGYITIGPANSAWAHIYTDRPAFLFNQSVYSMPGAFSSFSPSDLTLQTHGTTRMIILNSNGNVGIGTTTPTQVLNIYKPSSQTQFLIGNSNTSSGGYTSLAMGTSADVNGYSFIQSTKSSGSAFGDIVMNQYGGNVGIGTTSPNQKLTVNGTIYGKEVKVDLNVPGPDYVFEKDYKLPSLEEIKSYIDQHKHLPEVPSAKEMKQNGINLSEMNMILLKKVEELTLHIISQNDKSINEINSLRKENEEMKSTIAAIKLQLEALIKSR